jgi:hypothetical protein
VSRATTQGSGGAARVHPIPPGQRADRGGCHQRPSWSCAPMALLAPLTCPCSDRCRCVTLGSTQGVVAVNERDGHLTWDGGRCVLELLWRGEGITSSRDEEARKVQVGEVSRSQSIWLLGWVQWVAHEDEASNLKSPGRSHGAHPAAERSPPDRHPSGGHRELLGERRGRLDHRLDAHLWRIRSRPPRCLPRELHSRGRDSQLGEQLVDHHQTGLGAPPAGSRGEDEPDEPPRVHRERTFMTLREDPRMLREARPRRSRTRRSRDRDARSRR